MSRSGGLSHPRHAYSPVDADWDTGHPYAFRSWLRCRLPWFLVNAGVSGPGEDCEEVRGWHRWFNRDGETSGCYHCWVVRDGQLWREPDAIMSGAS